MLRMQPKAMVMAVIAALAIGFLVIASAIIRLPSEAARQSKALQASDAGSNQNFVQLPPPTHVQDVAALPRPTSAPLGIYGDERARSPTAMTAPQPTEDPYAG